MIQYKILRSDYADMSTSYQKSLQIQVNEHLDEGWELQGGVSVAESCTQSSSRNHTYAQAMIRRIEPTPSESQ